MLKKEKIALNIETLNNFISSKDDTYKEFVKILQRFLYKPSNKQCVVMVSVGERVNSRFLSYLSLNMKNFICKIDSINDNPSIIINDFDEIHFNGLTINLAFINNLHINKKHNGKIFEVEFSCEYMNNVSYQLVFHFK